MARKGRTSARKLRARQALSPTLIGAGLILLIFPLVLGTSPVAAALRPLAPLGLLLLIAGCGLLWWQMRKQSASAPLAPDAGPPLPSQEPFFSPFKARPPAEIVCNDKARSAPPAPPSDGRVGGVHDTWNSAVFEAIEWRRFEALVEALFAQAGFETKSQSHGADEGVDIWLYSKNRPGTPVSVVQCKHWRGKRVGVDKVRELRGVMAAKNVARGQFATTSTFTPDAESFAKDNGINLLGEGLRNATDGGR